MAKSIIMWSGGADSTLILHRWGKASAEDHPISALSIAKHRNLNTTFLKAQHKARQEYLKLAKQRGHHIKHETITIGGTFSWGVDGNSASGFPSAQPCMWLTAITNTIGKGDKILLGYVKHDCYWHFKEKFEKAFNAICALKGVEATIEYPLEWEDKTSVLSQLKKAKIPQRCWFSCESTEDGTPCGKCEKCQNIKNAKNAS